MNPKFMAKSIVIAAVYAALTFACYPLSYGAVQFRFSELMVLLAFIDPLYIPGLLLGCFLANLLGTGGLVDAVFGTFASLVALTLIHLTAKYIKRPLPSLVIASLWPSVTSFIIAFEMTFLLHSAQSFWFWTGMVALGEFVVVTVIGVPLFRYLTAKPHIMRVIRQIRK